MDNQVCALKLIQERRRKIAVGVRGGPARCPAPAGPQRDAKECRLRKAREDYDEANAYYYKLKENEESIRGIELMLHCIRQQIRKMKR